MKQMRILIIDDEKLIRWSLEKHLASQGYTVYSSETGEEGIRLYERFRPEIIITDNKLPGLQGIDVIKKIKSLDEDALIIFMTAYGSIDMAVSAMKAGASEYLNKPFSYEEVDILLDTLKKNLELTREVQVMRSQKKPAVTFSQVIGESPLMIEVKTLAQKIARTQSTTILLLGESGTGKYLFAKSIHEESPINQKPFVTINCSTLSETLLESELFGHEKGAFTDAKNQKKGLFEIASGGTVFLDEIGEINMSTQVKLLGVIENKVIKRVGGTSEIPIELRIIAATNKDLKKAVEEKSFREDLYYRLKVFQITLPALRDHKEDIKPLSEYFLSVYNLQFNKNISGIAAGTINLLTKYDWPGNIRELRNVIERAVILETSGKLQTENLPGEIVQLKSKEENQTVQTEQKLPADKEISPGKFEIPEEGISLTGLERQVIQQVLDKAGNNQTLASKLLRISRDTLRYKIKKYKL